MAQNDTAHLSTDLIAAYVEGTATSDGLREIDNHLETCDTCCQRIMVALGPVPDILGFQADLFLAVDPEMMAMNHLTDEELQGALSQNLDPETEQRVRGHLTECGICSEDLANLELVGQGLTQALTIHVETAIPPAETLEVPTVASRTASRTTWRETLQQVRTTLLAPFRTAQVGLKADTGAVPEDAVQLVMPISCRVLSDRPILRWIAHPNAATYNLTVLHHPEETPALDARDLEEPIWGCSQALERGRTYSWEVVAYDSEGDEIASGPLLRADSLFEVLDERSHVEVVRSMEGLNTSLDIAQLYLRFGLLDDLEQLAEIDPDVSAWWDETRRSTDLDDNSTAR